MMRRLWTWLYRWVVQLWLTLLGKTCRARKRGALAATRSTPRQHPIRPKPKWVQQEVIRLKALMPEAGCRTIAHHFNRRWQSRRQMTVSKTYVADTCRTQQYHILHARRTLKHRVPRSMPRNRIWACDLLTKTDQHGQPHLALAMLDHGSRACLRLQRLADKSSWTLVQELVQAVKQYGRPQCVRTDNDAVFVSRLFRLGLRLLGIRHQRIEPGCPWQNGRVERFIGTVKRELATESIADENDVSTALRHIRSWYNHDRPHDHLQGRIPAEVWAGVNIFAAKPG
jgi:putative transposase